MGAIKPGDPPAVSVILPTHNRAHLLRRSIQSVLGQSYGDFELLVVDDASGDGTAEVVRGFADSRVRLIRLETNVGGGAARNAGVIHARAPIIAFQDSDDLWLPHKLERCMALLENDVNLIGVFSAFWQVKGRLAVYGPVWVPANEQMPAGILRENFIDTPTSVLRRQAFEHAGGFDPSLPRYQDWELFIRLLRIGRLAFIEEPLVLSFVTPGSISFNTGAHGVAMMHIYEKHRAEIALDRGLHARWLANMGDAQLRSGAVADGRHKLVLSWRLRPMHPGMAIRLAAAWLGGGWLYGVVSRLLERYRKPR